MNPPRAPVALRCEHLENPVGIDEAVPRFSWWLPPGRRGTAQSACRILVASSRTVLRAGRGDVWDSERRPGSESNLVPYAGPALEPHLRYWWKVRYWDERGNASAWSAPAFFETGWLARRPWPAQWIGWRRGRPQQAHPARFLRGLVRLTERPAQARWYLTARGLFEPHLNGVRVGRDRLVPGWTEYRRRIEYLTYDVTPELRAGGNGLGLVLADGWYAGHFGFRGQRQNYGEQPAVLGVLRVTFADGSVVEHGTGSDWRVTTGPLRLADLYDGETVDARRDLGNWSEVEYDDRGWSRATVFSFPQVELDGKCLPPVRAVAELTPVAVTSPARGVHLFDLGQNMVGVARLRVRGRRGQRIVLRYGEMRQADGSLYTENLRTARATDTFICAGGGEEIFEPRFTFHGFRFVEVSGLARRPSRNAITGIVLNSDLPWSGGFRCSDARLNRLQENIRWSQRGNYLEVPTDCPQRNERMGWTGDAQVFITTGCFNMDARAFFTKWLRDLRDAQTPEGAFPDVAPDFLDLVGGIGTAGQDRVRAGNAAWADAGVICPWVAWLRHGDRRVLERAYESMTRWIGYQRDTSRDLIRPATAYGDWLATDAVAPDRAPTPGDLIGTAYFARSTELVAAAARVLGREDEARRWDRLRADIVAAFNREFVSPAGRIVGDTQTGCLLVLAFDLVPEALRPRVRERLLALIAGAGHHLTTGFVGTPLLCPVLSRCGRHDVAYQLVRQTSYPGWLFPVLHGATTMWERWNSWTPEAGFGEVGMNSFNHYAYGAIGEWLYGVAAGLDLDPAAPGYRRLRLAPRPGGGLRAARAWHDSPYGRVVSAWRLLGDRFVWRVVVPPNTTASARLPTAESGDVTCDGAPLAAGVAGVTTGRDGAVEAELVPGRYVFSVRHPGLIATLPVD